MKLYDEEMEKCVLGCMALNGSVIPNITANINETDFYLEHHREIYKAIVKLDAEKKGVNLLSINAETKYRLVEKVTTITDAVPTSTNWEYYTGQLKTYSMVRNTLRIKELLADLSPENVKDKVNEINQITNSINESAGGNGIRAAYDFMIPMLNMIEKAVTRKTAFSGYDTGLQNLNEIIDGLQNELYIIGARPSIGKSALALNIAKHLSSQGIKVGYFSLEMSGESLMMRALSDMASVQANVLRNGRIDQAGFCRINDTTGKLGMFPLYIDDNANGDINRICANARYMVRCLGVQSIFIDYISLLTHYNKKIPRHEQYAEIAVILQKLQKELKIPLIEIAQLTRDTEGKRPCLNDIRESGAFEQTVDCVILLDRERAESKDDKFIKTDAIVIKNRNGACGTAKLTFIPNYIRFIDDNETGVSYRKQ